MGVCLLNTSRQDTHTHAIMNSKLVLVLAFAVIACNAQNQNTRQQIRDRIAALKQGGRTRVSAAVQDAQQFIDTNSIQLNLQEHVNALVEQGKTRKAELSARLEQLNSRQRATAEAQAIKAQYEAAIQKIQNKNVKKEFKRIIANLETTVRDAFQPAPTTPTN